jgi:hypothetical protein
MTLGQGDLRLLQSEVARRLLSSRIPARFAYRATDGTPRVLATWFHWTGEVLTMPTFLAAPHVRHAAGRLRALRANPNVAVTIDTETFPPQLLTLRGRVEISEVDGVPPVRGREEGLPNASCFPQSLFQFFSRLTDARRTCRRLHE